MGILEKIHKNFINSIFEFSKKNGYSILLSKKAMTTDLGYKTGFDYPHISIANGVGNIQSVEEIPTNSFYVAEHENCYYDEEEDDDGERELHYPYMYENYLGIELTLNKVDIRPFIFFILNNALNIKEEFSLLEANLSNEFNLRNIIDANDVSSSGMKNELKVLSLARSLESLNSSLAKTNLLSDTVNLFENKPTDYKLKLMDLFPEKQVDVFRSIPYDFKDFVFKIFQGDMKSIKKVSEKQKFLSNFISEIDESLDISKINYKKISLFFQKELYIINLPSWELKDYEGYYASSIDFIKKYLVDKKLLKEEDLESSIKYYQIDIYLNPKVEVFNKSFLQDVIKEMRTNKQIQAEVRDEKNFSSLLKFLDVWFLNHSLNNESQQSLRKKQKI